MHCSNCGTTLRPDAQFCSACGQKFKSQKIDPNNKINPPPLSTEQKQIPPKNSKGIKLLVVMGVLAAIAFAYTISISENQAPEQDNQSLAESELQAHSVKDHDLTANSISSTVATTSELIKAVEGQLNALHQNDVIKAYREYVSQDFKMTTPLETFQEFIASMPILTHYRTSSVVEASVEENAGFVLASLTNENGKETFLEYTLAKEGDDWKIQGFRVDSGEHEEAPYLTKAKISPDTSLNTNINDNIAKNPEIEKVIATIEGQLKTLQDNDISKAYYLYTSKEFQQATTLEQYNEALKQYPLLFDYTSLEYDYSHASIDDNRANVSAILKNKQDTLLLDYALIKEDNAWKVWGSQIKENDQVAENSDHQTSLQDPVKESEKVIEVIKGQLNHLRANDLSKAFNDYVSTDFQQATPFSVFQEFVKNYPILTQYQKVTYSDVVFDNDKANVVVTLQKDQTLNPVEYTLVKIGDQWKVYGFRVLVEDQMLKELTFADRGEIIAIINDQLAALRNNDIQKTYTNTSKEFQDATPQKSFEEFIKNYPIFKENRSASFGEIKIDQQAILVPVTLNSDSATADVEFSFIKQDKQWKLWSLNILKQSPIAERPSSIKSVDLSSIIEAQLAAIRKNDTSKAYQDFTSKDFKEVTSLPDFEQFVQKNPVIAKNKSSLFGNLSFENDIGTYEGTLTSEDGETAPVKYRLVYEDKGWKILSINILYAPQPAVKLEFSKVIIGTDVNLEGVVTNPLTVLKSDQSKITASVYVNNASINDQVEVVLENVESASKIPPVSATLEKGGDSVVSFVFTPPTQGWPKGNYTLYVKASTGAQTTTTFKVE